MTTKGSENTMKDKIAMIAQSYYQIDSRIRNQAEALIRKDSEVDVISLRYNKKIIDTLNKVRIYQVPVKKNRTGLLKYLFEHIIFFLVSFLLITVLFFIKRYKICHVHNMPNFLVFSTIIPKLFGAKIILDIHDPTPELFPVKFKIKSKLANKLIRWEEKISISYANHVITVNDMVKNNLVARGVQNSKITVIINAPDTAIFDRSLYRKTSKLNSKKFVILFAGTVAERNGLVNIVNSIPLLRDRIPNFELRIIGEGDYLEKLKTVVKKLSIQKFVSFNPKIPLEQVPLQILESDAVVWLPERNEFIDLCLPVKVLESLIMGCPVITIKTKCQELYFDKNEVIFVNSLNQENIAKIILKLYEDSMMNRIRLPDSNFIATKFSWEKEKQKYYNLIVNLNNEFRFKKEIKYAHESLTDIKKLS